MTYEQHGMGSNGAAASNGKPATNGHGATAIVQPAT
jgi:hypothetical protein